jgi:cell division protein FtsN
MTEKRIVTIGVNINLGNYENLRLEVTDTAEDEADVRNLAEFLGHALDGFGMNNATTKAAIDKYKERVLDTHAPEEEDWSEYKAVVGSIPEPQENKDAPEKKETKEAGGEDTGEVEERKEEEETAGDEEAEERKEEEELAEEETEADKEVEEEAETKKTTEKTWVPAPIPAKPPVPRPQSVKPAPSPDGEYICEKCGAPISKVQRDVSNLFMGKTLCKNCMK